MFKFVTTELKCFLINGLLVSLIDMIFLVLCRFSIFILNHRDLFKKLFLDFIDVLKDLSQINQFFLVSYFMNFCFHLLSSVHFFSLNSIEYVIYLTLFFKITCLIITYTSLQVFLCLIWTSLPKNLNFRHGSKYSI